MALNGKYISLNSIMEQVYADNGYQFELPWVDVMMWTEEALNLIGHPRQYIRKVTGHKENPDLDIKNYRAQLPCDFHQLEQVAVNGMPAEYSGNTFHHLLDGDCCGIEGFANLAAHIQEQNWGTLVKVTSGGTTTFRVVGRVLDSTTNVVDIGIDTASLGIEVGQTVTSSTTAALGNGRTVVNVSGTSITLSSAPSQNASGQTLTFTRSIESPSTYGSSYYVERDDSLSNTEGGIMSFDMAGAVDSEFSPITFDLNNNNITLSVKEGKVCMAYLAIPTDEEGLPLIPEDTSYQLAVKKYLTMKVDYIAWRRGTLPQAIFQHSEQEWAWYVGQAGNKAKMPNLDQIEAIKNQTMRLLPNINAHETFFKTLGSPEIRKNFNR